VRRGVVESYGVQAVAPTASGGAGGRGGSGGLGGGGEGAVPIIHATVPEQAEPVKQPIRMVYVPVVGAVRESR